LNAAEPTDAERRAVATANVVASDDPAAGEKLFAEFATQYPESSLLSEAWLGQARARNRQGNYDGALELLRTNLPRAGQWTAQFEYWIGENLLAKGDLPAAETAFAGFIANHRQSTNVINAAVLQAFTCYQRKDFERTVALLADPAGAFEQSRAQAPTSEPAVNGLLLLAESRFELKRFSEVEPTLALLTVPQLPTSAAWRRVALRARLYAATDRPAEALNLMPEVLRAAAATDRPELLAESHALNGAVLEQLGRPADALAAYEPNLKPEVPAAWRAQALSKVVILAQATNGPEGALQKLELLSSQGLDEPARDLVQLTLGELRLRLFLNLPAAERVAPATFSTTASNLLAGALANFTNVVAGFTNSPLAGKAWLDRGRCHWEWQQWPAAAEAFGEAVKQLTNRVEQAQAVFKLADSLFQQNQFEPALTNYARVVQDYAEVPEVKAGLLDKAYYQIIKSAIQTGNQAAAEQAVKALLEQFPGTFQAASGELAANGLLLVGQYLSDRGEPARSRELFEKFATRFQNSALGPERDLAIARTYELEGKWPEAVGIYDRWLTQHTNHTARGTAAFHRAVALWRANDLTNAVAGFTQFVAAHPADPLAPKAYLWLGNHYDNVQEYQLAEASYQQIFGPQRTNWPVSRLTYEAPILASRSALERRLYGDASSYLTNLLKVAACPSNGVESASTDCCPRDVYAEALFAYGDVLSADAAADATRFVPARNAFDRVVKEFPDSPIVPAALGRIGECNLQLRAYDEATNYFGACLQHPAASVSERSRAEVGLGVALERKAEELPVAERVPLLDAARDRYLHVFYQGNLRADETPDPRWLQQSCINAARLAEARREWGTAARLYERLAEMLPVLKDYCEPLIRQFDERARKGG